VKVALSGPPGRTPDGPVNYHSLKALARECFQRLPAGMPVILNSNYTAPPDDMMMRWVNRRFPREFPILIETLIGHEFASSEAFAGKGQQKVKVGGFNFAWLDLLKALEDPASDPRWQPLITDLRMRIPD
jgi:hypothetical protein